MAVVIFGERKDFLHTKYKKSPDDALEFEKIVYLCHRLGGEIPSHRCISFYFALYRKDLGNLVWNSSI